MVILNKLHRYPPALGALLAMYVMASWIGKTHWLIWRSHYTIALLFVSSVLIFLAAMTLLFLIMMRNDSSSPEAVVEHFTRLISGVLLTLATTFYLLVDSDGILAVSRTFGAGAITFLSLSVGSTFIFLIQLLHRE